MNSWLIFFPKDLVGEEFWFCFLTCLAEETEAQQALGTQLSTKWQWGLNSSPASFCQVTPRRPYMKAKWEELQKQVSSSLKGDFPDHVPLLSPTPFLCISFAADFKCLVQNDGCERQEEFKPRETVGIISSMLKDSYSLLGHYGCLWWSQLCLCPRWVNFDSWVNL